MSRLLVVSNRLPVTQAADGGGLRPSSGGLASALASVRSSSPFLWLGAFESIGPDEDAKAASDLSALSFSPVFIDTATYNAFYGILSNGVLWPVLHYESASRALDSNTIEAAWDAYKRANVAFCAAVVSEYREGDTIWVHDYHLLPLCSLIRSALPSARIGYFLHTCFPSSSIWLNGTPWAAELLRGVIAADLIGVHTPDLVHHFLSSVSHALPDAHVTETAAEKCVVFRGHTATVGAFPIGIDAESFVTTLRTPATQVRLAELRASFTGTQVILGVDRMDPIKGVPARLLAFKGLLRDRPDLRGHVSLLLVAVPSRESVEEYASLKVRIETLCGEINAEYGSLVAPNPARYMFRSVDSVELTALYALADVFLVTSHRDGFNLTALEYVAVQEASGKGHPPGVLVLSEFTGAATYLKGVLLVNPHDTQSLQETLARALSLPVEERIARNAADAEVVKRCSATAWADSFLGALRSGPPACPSPQALPRDAAAKLLSVSSRFKEATSRALIISTEAFGGLDGPSTKAALAALEGHDERTRVIVMTPTSAATDETTPATVGERFSLATLSHLFSGESPPRFVVAIVGEKDSDGIADAVDIFSAENGGGGGELVIVSTGSLPSGPHTAADEICVETAEEAVALVAQLAGPA
jgi:alpha,alpha-trehalose-phosphate synthase [UDP-forming]